MTTIEQAQEIYERKRGWIKVGVQQLAADYVLLRSQLEEMTADRDIQKTAREQYRETAQNTQQALCEVVAVYNEQKEQLDRVRMAAFNLHGGDALFEIRTILTHDAARKAKVPK